MPIDKNEMEAVIYNAALSFLNKQQDLLVIVDGKKKKIIWSAAKAHGYSAAIFAKMDGEKAFDETVFKAANDFLSEHYPETLSQKELKTILDRAAGRAVSTYMNAWCVRESSDLSPHRAPSR